jgi:hypothetical protein
MMMKTMLRTLNPRRMMLTLTLAGALLALSGMLHSAQARLALSMGVATPQVSIQLRTGPKVAARVVVAPRRGLRVVRARRIAPGAVSVRCTRGISRPRHHKHGWGVSLQDRRIARRLSLLSGRNRHQILRLRRAGRSWVQIAFELRISRHDLLIAQNLRLRIG